MTAPEDQVEAWARALYESNDFYSGELDWSEMNPNDGGIHDLHTDMARAAMAVWEKEP